MQTPSSEVIRDAVVKAVKTGRSFHDYWYYTMTPQQHALFGSKLNFENRADVAYRKELESQERADEDRSIAVESYWKEKQGDDYGSY